jgi:hypothetical protein
VLNEIWEACEWISVWLADWGKLWKTNGFLKGFRLCTSQMQSCLKMWNDSFLRWEHLRDVWVCVFRYSQFQISSENKCLAMGPNHKPWCYIPYFEVRGLEMAFIHEWETLNTYLVRIEFGTLWTRIWYFRSGSKTTKSPAAIQLHMPARDILGNITHGQSSSCVHRSVFYRSKENENLVPTWQP